MSETFKNARAVIGTEMADVYVCPAATTAIVILAQVINIADATTEPTVQWADASNSNAVTRLIYATPIPAHQGMSVVSGSLVLEVGDKIQVVSETADGAEFSLSVLEIT